MRSQARIDDWLLKACGLTGNLCLKKELHYFFIDDYQNEKKLQKLMDKTVENILTALIEISGTILSEEGIAVENYGDALRKSSALLGFSEKDQENLAKLAIQRNRLAHRYLNFRWQAVKMFSEQRKLVKKLVTLILEKEEKKQKKD